MAGYISDGGRASEWTLRDLNRLHGSLKRGYVHDSFCSRSV
jgi:hypothetical protein